jgi:hypothetical protein
MRAREEIKRSSGLESEYFFASELDLVDVADGCVFFFAKPLPHSLLRYSIIDAKTIFLFGRASQWTEKARGLRRYERKSKTDSTQGENEMDFVLW